MYFIYYYFFVSETIKRYSATFSIYYILDILVKYKRGFFHHCIQEDCFLVCVMAPNRRPPPRLRPPPPGQS